MAKVEHLTKLLWQYDTRGRIMNTYTSQVRRFSMATSEEVARFAGVSRATVSRALNGSARASDKARERVHAAISALGYEPDIVAQCLLRQCSRLFAVTLIDDG